ncbi:hypothetical protein SAMN06295967_1271 [Belliella buryatensis]|uniref:Uncharacterized protein n=2 Tax=Belliella buryatensis TaxID=1500549 RepID=A0A239H714_9BACT|nr:hypothetical protein SAMN06295967_1271 [Belliella buryatensis]
MSKQLEEALNIVPSLALFFETGDGEIKNKICGSIFSNKIRFSNKEVRTIEWKPFMEDIKLINRELQNIKTKKAIISDGLSSMAPPLDRSCS